MEWIYNQPYFECDRLNKSLLEYAPWSGHRYFAYDFMCYYKPKKVVELGTHWGCSAFSFLQAIKDKNIDSQFYAIDSWKGDGFTEHDYQEINIYENYKKIINEIYTKTNNHIYKMFFDEALINFENNTIDLLHIDGSHDYDDVKHDFESWIPKVKNNGVIFFHDISEDKVNNEIMGSHKYWLEVSKIYPYTINFDFSLGLGVLFLSKEMYLDFIKNIDINRYQRLNNELAVLYKNELRKEYFIKLNHETHIKDLYKQIEIKDDHLNKYSDSVLEKNQYIMDLEKRDEEKNWILKDYENNVQGKDNYICELEKRDEEKNKILEEYKLIIQEKNDYIMKLEKQTEEKI
ncbi:class I SAM-dependent methyltransferase [Clostridium sp. KNHs205]|jgi:hypothetical protein|uniref:class I SAM-dependent methyltransferase n=1 Tax=Clostridium sp. KNHs205 TaxID=1449050 RepID=UPI00068924AB|nr:class I SAM-dependent methyltransferase [Clostridium sp. KNHs205]